METPVNGDGSLNTLQIDPEELSLVNMRVKQLGPTSHNSKLRLDSTKAHQQSRNVTNSDQILPPQSLQVTASKDEIIEVVKSKPSKRVRQGSIEPQTNSNVMSLPKMKRGRIANMMESQENSVAGPDYQARHHA